MKKCILFLLNSTVAFLLAHKIFVFDKRKNVTFPLENTLKIMYQLNVKGMLLFVTEITKIFYRLYPQHFTAYTALSGAERQCLIITYFLIQHHCSPLGNAAGVSCETLR